MFLSIKIHANKIISYSELMIFIRYENSEYCFMHHIQGNTIFHSTHAIFDEKLFFKCTNFHAKEYKLYNELLNKTSPETELLASNSSGKDGPAPIPISHILILPIQNNSPTCSPLSSLTYKSIFLPLTPGPVKLIVEIEETNDVDFDIEVQPPSPQWPLQPSLQTLQEDPKLRKSKCQTQEYSTNIL